MRNRLRNRANIMGRLGSDPDVKTTDSGLAVAKFSVATSEFYTKNGEKVEEVQWHNVVAWRQAAMLVQKFLKKGSEVAIEGKLVYRSWETDSGDKRYATDIVVDEIAFIGGKPQGQEAGEGNEDDEPPFDAEGANVNDAKGAKKTTDTKGAKRTGTKSGK